MSTPVPIIRAKGEGDKRTFFGGGIHTWKLTAEDLEEIDSLLRAGV